MAENNPSIPGGAVPPKGPEASKVQPKKETVRINLPPKPSAAPTIKLPTLPPGGPSAGTPGPIAPPPAAPVAAAAAPAAAAPSAAVGAPKAAGVPAAGAPKSVQRPMPRPAAAPTVSGLDKGLAIAAAITGLAAVGSAIYCMTLVAAALTK